MPPQTQFTPPINPPENVQPRKKILILIVLGFILITISAYFLWHQFTLPIGQIDSVIKNKQNLDVVTTQDKFKNWKTYRNEKYGFEILIPKDLRFEERTDDIIFISTNKEQSEKERLIEKCLKKTKEVKYQSFCYEFNVNIDHDLGFIFYRPDSGQEIKDDNNVVWMKEESSNGTSYGYIGNEEGNVRINNIDWKKYRDPEGFISYRYSTGNNGYQFDSRDHVLMKEILSTFYFTRPAF